MKFLRKGIMLALGVILLCSLAIFSVGCNNKTPTPVDAKEVSYKVEVYLQSDAGYELNESYGSTGKGKVGDSVTLTAPSVTGYVYNSSYEGNVDTLVLSETEGNNVFKFYYDKDQGAVVEKFLSYNANERDGMSVRGNMSDTKAAENGSVVIAENVFYADGYRFAGWNPSKSEATSGKVRYASGETISIERSMTLYAVWDEAYMDRFGGTDEIFLPSGSSKAILRRGGIEFETQEFINEDEFVFTRPDGTKLKCKVYDDHSYAYAQENLAGTYSFKNAYYNPEDPNGNNAINLNETLTLDEYGSGAHTYTDNTGKTVTDNGHASLYNYMSSTDTYEYLFLITEGKNSGNAFVFKTEKAMSQGKEISVFSSTNGEAGIYGSIGQNCAMQLDGYGNLIFEDARYSSTFDGIYWIDNVYVANVSMYIFRINVRINDDPGHGLTLLRYNVVDGVLSMNIYTTPLEEGYGTFYEPHSEGKEYTSKDGSTLKLDGFGMFPDSAIYTTGGETIKGAYEADWTAENNLTITLHEVNDYGAQTGMTYVFKIDIRSLPNSGMEILNTFSVLDELKSGTTYILLDGAEFGTEAIHISDEYSAQGNGYEAEYGIVSQDGFTVKAKGYADQDTEGVEGLWTFTRTALEQGVNEKDVPTSIVFSVGEVYDSNYFTYDIYYVYSVKYGDKKEDHYVNITDANGSGKHMWYITDTLAYNQYNIGAIFFDSDGNCYEGSLYYSSDSSYFGTVGTFTYTDNLTGMMSEMYFSIQLGANGQPATFEEISELEYPVINVLPNGNVDASAVRLVIRGNEGLYAPNGDLESGTYGTVKIVGTNIAGENIWAFINENEIELFRFIMADADYYEQGYGWMSIVIYYVYDEDIADTYTSDECGKLLVDGYHWAEYTDANGKKYTGTYTLSNDKKIVYFTSREKEFVFDISETLSFADGIYGTYAMFAGNTWWDITFDGHGNAKANNRRGKNVTGIYIKDENGNVDLFINIEEGVNSYKLMLTTYEESGEAYIFEENIEGAYIGEDWSVVYLDGYRTGRYYFHDGSGYTRIYYEELDEEIGFFNIKADPSGAEQNIILNKEKKTFKFPKYVERRYVYYGEDLSSLIFEPTGDIFINYTWGYYVLTDTVCRAYVMNMNLAMMRPEDLNGKPGDKVYELNGKKYYLYEQGQKVKLTGEVEIDYNSTHETKEASLEFNLTGSEIVSTKATFKVGEETYTVDIVSMYMDYDRPDDMFRGLSIADYSQYEYSEFTEYHYNGDGKGTFKVVITPKEMVMEDGFERQNGITSTLTEYRIGFGPISIESRKLSGHIYVGKDDSGADKYFDFSEKDIETVYNYETDQGNRYNIIFDVDGVTYSMQYNKEDNDYRLYMIGKYELINAGDYAVGVIRYVYSNGAYSFSYQEGDFADMILYKVDKNKNRTPIVAFSKMINNNRTSGWYIDLGTYDPVTERGDIGSIYTVKFSNSQLSKVEVNAYDFEQALQPDDDLNNYYFANLCLKDGKVVSIAALAIGGEFGSVDSSVKQNSNNSLEEKWLVTCNESEEWILTLYKDAQGNYVRNNNGTFKMTLQRK